MRTLLKFFLFPISALFLLVFSLESFSKDRGDLMKLAHNLTGSPYVWDTNGPSTFDCSGFVHFVIAQTADPGTFKLPYKLKDMPGYRYQSVYYRDYLNKNHAGISCDWAKKGDIVFFPRTQTEFNHIGLISGTAPLYFITAQSKQMGVRELPFFKGSYWGSRKPECYKNLWIK